MKVLARLTAALPLIAIATALALGGCNTVKGAGKDIESAGDAIEDTAQDAKD